MSLDLGELVAYLDLDTSKWDQAVDRAPKSISGKAAAFGAAGLVIGGALAAAMAKGLTDAIDFQQSNAKIAAQLGLTEAESARVGTLAGKVYAQNYGESVEQVQQAIGGVVTQIRGMGDASDSTVDRMTKSVLNYASAFGVETSEAIAMVQQLMSSGLATSADNAMDLMTTAMQKVPEALRGDMSDAITEYGPLLADMGYTGAQAFDLLASGADRGMYGIDKAGDALKELGIRVGTDLAASGPVLESLGLNAQQMSNDMLAGGEQAQGAISSIVDALLGVEDPSARAQAAVALFGTPLEDLGAQGIPEFLGSLTSLGGGFEDVAGATDSLGSTLSDNVASQMEAVNRQIGEMFRGLMSTLLPALQAVFGFLAENPAVLQAVAIALGVLAVAFTAAAVAQWAMNSAMLASPITWIILAITAVIAVIVLLAANWDTVVKFITDVWNGFIGWLTGVMDGFAGWWNDIWTAFGKWVTDVWNGFVGFITDLWNGFVSWLTGIVNNVAKWWNGVWSGIASFFTDLWNTLVSWFMNFTVWGWLIQTIQWVASNWNAIWSGISSFFTGLWSGLVAWATSTIGNFIAGWRAMWGALTGFFSGLWSGISSGVTSAWNGVIGFFQGVPSKIMGFFAGIGTWLLDSGRALIRGFVNGITGAIGMVGDAIGGVMDFIGGFFPNSPAKRGQFSGSGWTRLTHSGAAIMEEFVGGMHGADPFDSTFEARVGEAVRDGSLALDVKAQRTQSGVRAGVGTTIINNNSMDYHAAENRALSSEEELFAALGSPRSPFGTMGA